MQLFIHSLLGVLGRAWIFPGLVEFLFIRFHNIDNGMNNKTFKALQVFFYSFEYLDGEKCLDFQMLYASQFMVGYCHFLSRCEP